MLAHLRQNPQFWPIEASPNWSGVRLGSHVTENASRGVFAGWLAMFIAGMMTKSVVDQN
jgi:hypothetical protein